MRTITAAALLFAFSSSAWTFAQEAAERSIRVTGTATVKGDVDRLTWQISIRGTGDSLEKAGEALVAATDALEARIEEIALPAGSLRFSRTKSGRVYETGPDRTRVFRGFYAEKGGQVRLESIESSEAVEAALLADDAVEITSLSMDSSVREQLKMDAGKNAVAAAKEKAAAMAGVLGAELGKVLRIEEGTIGPSSFVTRNTVQMPAFGEGGSAGFEEVEVQVTVTVQFALQ